MKSQHFIINIYDKMSQELERDLTGLSLEDINWQPSADTNSMGWLTWHLDRCQDRTIADLRGEKQLWISDQWHVKFNRPADPQDFGLNATPEELISFKSPDVNILLEYHQAVYDTAKEYISNLTETDLDRETGNPRWPTVWASIQKVINDNYQHIGQIAYLRGLLKGMGWKKYFLMKEHLISLKKELLNFAMRL